MTRPKRKPRTKPYQAAARQEAQDRASLARKTEVQTLKNTPKQAEVLRVRL